MIKIISIIKLIFISLGIFLFFLYFLQENLIFANTHIPKKKSFMLINQNTTELFFMTKDNTKLNGIYLENGKNLPTTIYFGGNAEDSTNFIEIATKIKNYNFLIFNYRGYALSEGISSKKTILNDALEIYDKYLDENSVAIGRSLGSSVATYLASKREIKKLLIITPFDSLKSIADDMFYIPISFLLKHNFDTVKYIKNLKTPTFMLVALEDKIVPKKYSDNLKKNIDNLVIYREIDATHNNLPYLLNLKFLNDSLDYTSVPSPLPNEMSKTAD